jgi:beta-lactamase class C
MEESTRKRSGKCLAALAGLIMLAGTTATLVATKQGPVPGNTPAQPVAAGPSADPDSNLGPSQVDYRRLEARIASLMQKANVVGLAAGTVERGQVRFVRGYGETLAGSGEPVTPDTVFRWASLSKGVAGSLLAKLAGEGKLSLEAPLTTMRTTRTLPGDASKVTVADVLSHRLGLVRNAWDERLEAGEDPATG